MTEHDMTTFWHWWVIVLTVANIVGIFWLIRWTSKRRAGEVAEGQETGHVWDGNLSEYNNPLPRWWLWMFYLTIVFSVIYLALYPGLGRFAGFLGWSSVGQYQQEASRFEERFGPIFAAYADRDLPALARDEDALRTGQRLFLNYCSTCHGSDARGAPGFPNLTDGQWQWGSSPADIHQTIMAGRQGVMPAMGDALGADGVEQVTHYVLSLAGRSDANTDLAELGAPRFAVMCAVCHGAEGTGNTALGAPDLTNNIWLYGGSAGAIARTIREGRHGVMPAFGDFLGEDRVHVLAAYVYSLSHQGQ
ncbi:cytochrome c oxidase, cbb3-type, subunit III [Thioalkalivibrio sulfidiphilus HL-EbGr7]|uniref:Cbb3-type cytochrome c oxidase subunit n=1 Tax=Thioalkalivibrio sulfidiphilus (strain HL-EbGR7) TaxID=396588 RepID=B8GLX5_THISH|nr:cytochrome-c oxidase, cbb3-type subunit III [Thioalkalivibrio sulfidiphilus]ACL71728.1 cytochrome c oxidase, cbb3-type, subunit III [Thioalkalivibrio sulfidiphilus HL-EbGr7]